MTVPRGHVEALETGDGLVVEVKLGVWITNTKTRRAKLSADQLDRLADAGLDWR